MHFHALLCHELCQYAAEVNVGRMLVSSSFPIFLKISLNTVMCGCV